MISFAPPYGWYAAYTVDGGQILSMSATENRAGAEARLAKFTPSK